MRERLICLLLACAALAARSVVRAEPPAARLGVRAETQAGWQVALARPGQIRVDGGLGEWRGLRFRALADAAAGPAELCLAHDASGLYVAARVHDEQVVRTAQPGPAQDALVLTLALPAAGHWLHSELWLYPGVPGQHKAIATLRTAAGSAPQLLAAPAQIVEGPLDGGYTLEAFVPWSALGRDVHWRFARAALRLHDVDRAGAAAREPSGTRAGAAAELPWLIFEGGPVQALTALLREKNLGGATPRLDWVGELRGDGKAVRVLVLGSFVVLSDELASFTFEDLPVTSSADLLEAQLRDLTGDARPELIVRLRQRNELGSRELWRVLDLQPAHASPLLTLETRKQTAAGDVEADVELRAGAGHAVSIVVRAGRARGLDASNYQEAPASGVEPILLPWGPLRERQYAWDGTRFAVSHELANPHAQLAEPARAAVAPLQTQVAAPLAPLAPPADSAALLQAYRQARGLAANARPSRSVLANVAEDARAESVLVFGNELVVVGEGFRGGTGFFYFALPVRDPADILQLSTSDVSGDGRGELFVRVRQHIGDVERELLLGYSFVSDVFRPILSTEVRRARGSDSIANAVSFVRQGKSSVLQISAGSASGWSAESYPFSTDSRDGVDPLLLPWRDTSVRYHYVDQRLLRADPHP